MCLCVLLCARESVFVCVCVRARLYLCVRVCVCMRVRVRACERPHEEIQSSHIHAYTHIHATQYIFCESQFDLLDLCKV